MKTLALYRTTGTTIYVHASGCNALNRAEKYDRVFDAAKMPPAEELAEQGLRVRNCKCTKGTR